MFFIYSYFLRKYIFQFNFNNETANFLEHIRRWWNLLNIKSTLTGKEKRDDNRQALNVDNLNHHDFLSAFSSWLEDWKNSQKRDLSKETFD